MTEKQFTFNKDTVATNLKTPITYNNKTMSIGEVLEKLNEIADENVQLKKCNSKAKNHIEDIIFLLNNTPSQTLSRDDLITLVQKTKEYLE